MGHCLPTLMVLGAMLAGDLRAHSFRVFVNNLAGLTPRELEGAEEEAARILATADVRVIWINCMESGINPSVCPGIPGPAVLALQILPAAASALPVAGEPGALGFAVPSDWCAAVLYGRVKSLQVRATSLRQDVLLGHVVAHELGHVLLGLGGHSKSGIMKALWSSKSLEQVARGQLVFDANQKRLIRHNIAF